MLLALVAAAALVLPARAQIPSDLYNGMQWRLIGPFRGGRVSAVIGVPNQPNVFYMNAENGGVWKSVNYGMTWVPLFTGDENDSVGSIAVAPSDPNVIYAGSGEATMRPDLSIGDGLYKSTDAGKTWQHLGLRDGQQLASIVVDPHNPDRLFVAVLGHPYGPNAERGIFRSTDGGRTFQKVLYKDENTGAAQVAFAPSNPDVVYAVLWAARDVPAVAAGVNAARVPGSGLFESTDGGTTWHQIGQGLPTVAEGLGRIRIAIAPSNPNRVYASAGRGIYRSDDAGRTFQLVSHDRRTGGGYLTVAPDNPDELYASQTALYRSMDGGKTFTAFRGAPGGNDYHHVWINPANPQIMAVGVDQGATLSVDGGRTWSTWYNQPTAQAYHVITDNQFPYRVYSAQQDSGSFGLLSRSNDGQTTFRDWHPVGADEDGYIAPDPLHPDIIYSSHVVRYDWVTGESQFVGPQVERFDGKYRFSPYAPLIFSPADPHVLYLGGNVLLETRNGGHSWQAISHDLSRADPGLPATLGPFGAGVEPPHHRGVIYSIGPSFKTANTIWVGTTDGLIWVTRDGGKNWRNVTPPAMTPWSTVTQIVASHFDDETAYASVSRFFLDDLKPYIYATHDGGKTWKLIVNGLPDNAPVNVVREDPVEKGLLFAGTERAVWFSADDGAHWQSLQLNLPVNSMRDLVVHDNDLVLATHGRSDWILDDITPLRQLAAAAAAAPAFLYRPEAAYQVPRNTYTDTQLEPEFPAGQNPPSGAIIDYDLKGPASGPVTLEIFDAAGKLVRRYASTDTPAPVNADELNFPTYWLRSPQVLSAQAGMHRFVWDLHYPSPHVLRPQVAISVILHDSPIGPLGPDALPGRYTVKLTADGHTYTQPLTVKMDPRNKTPMVGLTQQFRLAMRLNGDINRTSAALQQAGGANRPALLKLNGELVAQYNSLYGASYGGTDGNSSTMATPTTQQVAAVADLHRQVVAMLKN
ncbi:MAG: glycoside hydrolase [Acidobacteriota bacterium]|nr:glycoside hydrolase [Acidobacteriota bacterium]